MIIKKITIEEYKKPFIAKTFLGKDIFSHRKGWYIKIHSDKIFGIGESAPIPGISLENHAEAGYALEGFIIETLLIKGIKKAKPKIFRFIN